MTLFSICAGCKEDKKLKSRMSGLCGTCYNRAWEAKKADHGACPSCGKNRRLRSGTCLPCGRRKNGVHNVNFCLPEPDHAELRKAARKLNVTLSEAVRTMIEWGVETVNSGEAP